jgi:triacylglycerol lipase
MNRSQPLSDREAVSAGKQQVAAQAVVQDRDEVPLRLHSRIDQPIAQLTFLQRALLMAELAMIAYNDEDEARRAFHCIGFDDVSFFERDGAQAYRIRNRHDCLVSCRGTEPNEWNDIRADANATSVLAETVGKVHRGFKREVDDLWPMLETALMGNDQPLWFCGHSLGGAMATICAGRCFLSHIESHPTELYTFGSPRVGNKRYINYVKLRHYRFVNNNDIVTRVPPAWFGYRHNGIEVYLDHRGRINQLGGGQRRRDRVVGFLKALGRGKIDHFQDHSIHRYISVIAKTLAETGGAANNEPGVVADEPTAGRRAAVAHAQNAPRVDPPHVKSNSLHFDDGQVDSLDPSDPPAPSRPG